LKFIGQGSMEYIDIDQSLEEFYFDHGRHLKVRKRWRVHSS
jgi:hypothetical protein